MIPPTLAAPDGAARRRGGAPVSVAMSTIASTPRASAYTSASASVSRPSASVLITSIVLPFDAGQ